ncbi:hypothetical protein CRYUN_Cryun05aG0225200 [Craigia yunnanensis]
MLFLVVEVIRLEDGTWTQNLEFVNQREMVEIDLLNGITELELARFILKHAKKLKKMVIFHSSSFARNCGE